MYLEVICRNAHTAGSAISCRSPAFTMVRRRASIPPARQHSILLWILLQVKLAIVPAAHITVCVSVDCNRCSKTPRMPSIPFCNNASLYRVSTYYSINLPNGLRRRTSFEWSINNLWQDAESGLASEVQGLALHLLVQWLVCCYYTRKGL